MICSPIYLITDKEARTFGSLEEAALYMEWVNAANPMFPNYNQEFVLLDQGGRRIYLHAEFGEVRLARLESDQATPEDLNLLARSKSSSSAEKFG